MTIELSVNQLTPDYTITRSIDEKTGAEQVEKGEAIMVVTFEPVILTIPEFNRFYKKLKNWRVKVELTS